MKLTGAMWKGLFLVKNRCNALCYYIPGNQRLYTYSLNRIGCLIFEGMTMQLFWTSSVSIATLLMYFWVIVKVGQARQLYQVMAPSIEGPAEFMRALRVQANTVEQLVFHFPALWLCAYWFNDKIAAMLGLVWIVGRMMYALNYLRDPVKRGPGFVIATIASSVLLAGAIFGLLGFTFL